MDGRAAGWARRCRSTTSSPGDVDRLGRLAEFVDRLEATLADLSGERPLAAWIAGTRRSALDALTDTAPADAWQDGPGPRRARRGGSHRRSARRRRAAPPRRRAGVARPSGCAGARGGPTSAPARLTVATMVPMRSVPHRVICLLGLDDGAFPRAGVDDGDDVLARDPVIGERDLRAEDRQLLLDAVCAATEHLVVLYSGADARTGARRPPAVPVGELLDAVAATASPGAEAAVVDPASAATVRRPQLHRRCARRAQARSASTASSWRGAGPAAAEPTPASAVPARSAARRPGARVIALDDLVTFAEHPVKQFLRQRVGLPVSDSGRRCRRRAARRPGRAAALGRRRPAPARPAHRPGPRRAAGRRSGGVASCRPASWVTRCSARCWTTSRSWSPRAPGTWAPAAGVARRRRDPAGRYGRGRHRRRCVRVPGRQRGDRPGGVLQARAASSGSGRGCGSSR